ncbi:MAG: glutathione S-transferase family protein [Burkholderiaceae bacterium]
MKFYDCSTAPSPRRVRMFIAEKGLDIPVVEVNLREQEQLSAEFLKINPQATVPVLELDDGSRLLSTAGCRAYLESAYPTPALLGRTPSERGRVADIISKIENNGLAAVAEALRNSAKAMKNRAVPGPDNYEQIPELAERGRQRAARFFKSLDQIVGQQAFMAGDAFSAADIDALMFVDFVKWIKVAMPDDCENLIRWYGEVSQRPSAKL